MYEPKPDRWLTQAEMDHITAARRRIEDLRNRKDDLLE